MRERPSHKPADRLVAVLVGTQIGALVFTLVWLPVATGSYLWFASAAPPLVIVILLFALWLYPVALVSAAVVAWRAYRRGNRRRATVATWVPYLWVVPVLVLLTISAVLA